MLTASGQIAEETQVAIRDLVQLSPLNEETVLLNLQLRYKKDQIYTFLGSLLISINPFKRLAYYSPSLISQYQDAACIDDLPPHVYSLTHHVYRCMLQGDSDQAIVVTGEAASGKTENAKIALQYLVCSGTSASELLREQLINANFVLEAFGNASTLHNDNSSRFVSNCLCVSVCLCVCVPVCLCLCLLSRPLTLSPCLSSSRASSYR